jgi:signal transduction histidine kinase/DNA-binding response OmpR family regulator
MNESRTKKLIHWVDQYLYDPRLEPESLLRKRWAWMWMVVNLSGISIMTLIALTLKVWVTIWFPFSLILIHLIALIIYPRAKRFDLVINIAYGIVILITFVMLLQIGGLKTSLGFVFIGLNCAMGSVLAGNLRWSVGMFVLYGITIILLGILDPYFPSKDYITHQINILYFVLNAVWVNACILFLTVFYMKDKSRFEKAETNRIKKIDEAKTQLYTNISHEFRTPLTVIQGMAEQMEKHPEKWNQTGPGKIKQQSQSLLRLVNQMLDISKIEAESMELHLIHGDIRRFVQYITASFHSLAENNKIHLQIDINKTPLYTDYDPDSLMHIMSNLLSNAIKFTEAGGNIKVSVGKHTEKGIEFVNIHVKDTGKGIPKEAVDSIFDRFYQVPDKYDQTPGTGLGLALTRELVRLMKGEISVKSEVGLGSEFIVSFPVTKNAKEEKDDGISQIHPEEVQEFIPQMSLAKDLTNQTNVSAEKFIILVVEDNIDVVEYLVAALEGQYMIEIASNGKQGLEKAIEIIPDIILTDVMMPIMDGFELLKALKGDLRTDHIPVVVLTAKADFSSKLTGLEIGADHYLAKPFSEKELFLKLNNLLEAKRKMQQKLGMLPSVSQKGNAHYKFELQFMARINKLIEENLANENFDVSDVCSGLNMSRPQLYRKFTAITNKSIGRYIRSYRLHKAKVMMEQEGKNVTEAAFDSGFKNLSHFSASFKEEFGCSPSELL